MRKMNQSVYISAFCILKLCQGLYTLKKHHIQVCSIQRFKIFAHTYHLDKKTKWKKKNNAWVPDMKVLEFTLNFIWTVLTAQCTKRGVRKSWILGKTPNYKFPCLSLKALRQKAIYTKIWVLPCFFTKLSSMFALNNLYLLFSTNLSPSSS